VSKVHRALSKIRELGKQIDWYKAHPLARRRKLFQRHRVDLLLDIGANVGQYGRQMRRLGYRGRILSFEPLSTAFTRLQQTAHRDGKWEVANLALGGHDGQAELRVSGDGRASSLLEMTEVAERIGDYFPYVGKECIQIRRLDTLWERWVPPARCPFLKIDAQGFESQILDGAKGCLRHVVGLQIEMSLVPLYKDEALMPELVTRLLESGFTLMSLEYGFCDPRTGQLLQVDGIFFRP
jgi:FkbM family methyltransferase